MGVGRYQKRNKKVLWDVKIETQHNKSYAAKSLQSCLTLCDPRDGSPPGSPIPGILQARTLEWVAISFSNAWKWNVKVKSLSHVRPSVTPWTASRQEYWSGVPLPSPTSLIACDKSGSKREAYSNKCQHFLKKIKISNKQSNWSLKELE